jgi:hypothetical protein
MRVRQAAMTGFVLAQGTRQMTYQSELNKSKSVELHSHYRHESTSNARLWTRLALSLRTVVFKP